jgi:hypothetical protein
MNGSSGWSAMSCSASSSASRSSSSSATIDTEDMRASGRPASIA